ncbi:hypothetical protein [Actinomadura harenae]|uniref:Uncharacterized protein n=1 Tax=Actinomadura harenae TaxID=2483351 RepID=A0A3M2LV61_9ACTN|nr:hypothetical protein [Actinomadura harenae]RMI39905.1 hypothetical protein EBO15_28480 [Actinomadura harenae]
MKTGNQLDRVALPTPPSPARVGQATAVEQSRAVAEVHASVLLARESPRNIAAAQEAIRQVCTKPTFAERAFYSFPRGDGTVNGESIYLARELARCWGNIQYGVNELRRDDVAGESEILAWAWDVETNTRASQTFIVPHARDTKKGRKPLIDLRDIYENNANNGSRRLREAIFAVLPSWLIEDAKQTCSQTLEQGNGTSLEQRVAEAVDAFGQQGITAARLEAKVGKPRTKWTGADIARLEVVFRSLSRRETTIDDEFPVAPATAEEILAARNAAPPSAPDAEAAAQADAVSGRAG